jgi:uncharacterized protein (DUF305 family)
VAERITFRPDEDADAVALAESIRDSQNGEIAEMEQLLTDLGG